VALLTFVFVYPFYVILLISLNDSIDLMNGYPLWLPRKWTIENYSAVLRSPILIRAVLLSVSRTVATTAAGLICNGMLAFALTRKELLGRRLLNQIFILTMYVSGGLIPYYLQINSMGLINNFWVFVLPYIVSVYYVLIIKSYFNGLPDSVEESAKLDGCNELQSFFNIVLPRVRDFRGVSKNSFDGRGNYSMGLKEQSIFPEIVYDRIEKVKGMNVIFTTSAKTDEEAAELLRLLGMPFEK